jgi:hypothetical protein
MISSHRADGFAIVSCAWTGLIEDRRNRRIDRDRRAGNAEKEDLGVADAGSNPKDWEKLRGDNLMPTETPQCSREDLRDARQDEDLGG